MALSPGTSLGPYEIRRAIGRGGMGEVYAGIDTRLDRTVAIKILTAELASDPERRQRFEREAKAIAALNHPHICTLYEFDSYDGTDFLVMEHLEGETLQDRLKNGALPLDHALQIAIQIADGLGEAHEQRMTHRDLKPANIFLTTSGAARQGSPQAKLLDFGLAKLGEQLPTGEDSTKLADSLTARGTILGTFHYMAPEQLEGRMADARSDIWAFGCVLYEMVTGRKAFEGKSQASVAAAIIEREPSPMSTVEPMSPRALDRVVSKCLAKAPERRWQSARDLGDELQWIADGGARPDAFAPPVDRSRPLAWRRALAWAAGVALVGVTGGLAGWQLARQAPTAPSLATPVQLTANGIETSVTGMAISPDGRYLAYADGTGVTLRVTETGETSALTLPESFRVWNLDWYPNGTQLLLNGIEEESGMPSLWLVSMLGGTPRRLVDGGYWPSVAPDGSRIAFLAAEGLTRRGLREVWIMGAAGENPRRLVSGGDQGSIWSVTWSPDSQWVAYGIWRPGVDGTTFEIRARHVEGDEDHALVSDARLFQNWAGILPFEWGSDGRLIYARAEEPPNHLSSNLWTLQIPSGQVGPVGEPRRLTQTSGFNHRQLSVTADASRMVSLMARNQGDVYVGELSTEGPGLVGEQRMTFDEREDHVTGWMRDGSAVLFESTRTGSQDVFSVSLDGRREELVVGGPLDQTDAESSSDGAWILYQSQSPRGRFGEHELLRAPTAGGPSEAVLTIGPMGFVRCTSPPDATCVLGERIPEDTAYAFYAFDPMEGKGAEISRVPDRPPFTRWDISSDAQRIAMVHNDDNRIRVLSLATGQERDIVVRDWSGFEFVSWAADGNGMYLSGGFARRAGYPELIHVDMEGTVTPLRRNPNEWHVRPESSPDGRYLAFVVMPFHANVWMIEETR